MRGIDYRSLYEDLVIKLDTIEEKALRMEETGVTDSNFRELLEMISDAANSTWQDRTEEEGIENLCREASKCVSRDYDTELVSE